MGRHLFARIVPAVVVGLVLGSSAMVAGAAPVDRGGEHAIGWRACGGDVECARIPVPVSYAADDGTTIELAVARLAARAPDERVGALVVNPGGPGVSGIAGLEGLAEGLPGAVRDRFDLVSFDPRGVGDTTPVDCTDTLDPVFDASFSPRTGAERASLVDALRRVAGACASRNGSLLTRVSTLDAARDLEALRSALGDDRLNYLGLSYGTYLGVLYAAMFPDRVRAMVLDGAIDPSISAAESTLLQARGFERNLDAFLDDCSRRRACPFHHDGDSAGAYDELRKRVVSEPIPAARSAGRALNDTRFDAAVLQLLYSGRAAWDTLARGLVAAADGDSQALLAVADRFVGRGPDGTDDDTVEAFWAVSCLDGPLFGDVDDMAGLQERAVRSAPRLGAFVVNFSLACSVWPVTPGAAAPAIDGVAPNALVIGTTADPATPLVSSQRLARALGGAPLVVANGDRHTAFATGNRCVDRAVANYLVSRRAPKSGTRC